jgi:hypothetical protein
MKQLFSATILGVVLLAPLTARADIVSTASGQVVSEVTGSIMLTFDNGFTQVFELAQDGDASINIFADGTAQLTNMKLVEPFSRNSAGVMTINGFGRYEVEGGFCYDATLTAETPIGDFAWHMNLRRIGETVDDPGFGTYASSDAPIAVRNRHVGQIVEVILQLPRNVDTGVEVADLVEDAVPTSTQALADSLGSGGGPSFAMSSIPGIQPLSGGGGGVGGVGGIGGNNSQTGAQTGQTTITTFTGATTGPGSNAATGPETNTTSPDTNTGPSTDNPTTDTPNTDTPNGPNTDTPTNDGPNTQGPNTDTPTTNTTPNTVGPVVPEPSSMVVWAGLGLGFLYVRRKRLFT